MEKTGLPDKFASLCPGGRFFPYFLEIQFLCHKIICQQIADNACGQREQQAENPAHPEVGRTVYCAFRSDCQRHAGVAYHSCDGRKDHAQDAVDHRDAHVDAHRRKDFVGIKAVSHGDAHVDHQDAADRIHQDQQKVERDPQACRNPEGVRKAAEHQGQAFRQRPQDVHVDEQAEHGKDHENDVDNYPDQADDKLAPDMGRGRHRKGVHQIALVREQVFAEPDDFQVDSGNQGHCEQGQDIEHDQRGVQEAEPDII